MRMPNFPRRYLWVKWMYKWARISLSHCCIFQSLISSSISMKEDVRSRQWKLARHRNFHASQIKQELPFPFLQVTVSRSNCLRFTLSPQMDFSLSPLWVLLSSNGKPRKREKPLFIPPNSSFYAVCVVKKRTFPHFLLCSQEGRKTSSVSPHAR